MKQQNLFDAIPRHRLESLTRDELIEFNEAQSKVIEQFQKHIQRLEALNAELEQKSLFVEEQYITIKNKMFGKSSERQPKASLASNSGAEGTNRKKILLPSERYPEAALIERHVTMDQIPSCGCCGTEMEDSGMSEDSEYLTVIPKQYIVVREMRHKYRCGKCHGDIKTAPKPPRVKPGSAYSDEMMIDVSLSKYCDLIPIERYAKIAEREGIKGLPPQSLIETSHYLADYIKDAYHKLKTEICASPVLHADETPHRMLEGDKKCSWYLWGFSNAESCYFEYHNTRSGDVASHLLKESNCQYLVSDVFSGYSKAVSDTNTSRKDIDLPLIKNIYCNAHARRKFSEACDVFLKLAESAKSAEAREGLLVEYERAKFYVDEYAKIYKLWSDSKEHPPDGISQLKLQMQPHFELMRDRAMSDKGGYSEKSSFGKAMRYFLNNYEGLTRFLDRGDLPIDNNPAERLLRSPVIGRKTWYGTHSKLGAKTSAILFSLVESCKLNKVNPREYIKCLVADLHQGKSAYTPFEYKKTLESQIVV